MIDFNLPENAGGPYSGGEEMSDKERELEELDKIIGDYFNQDNILELSDAIFERQDLANAIQQAGYTKSPFDVDVLKKRINTIKGGVAKLVDGEEICELILGIIAEIEGRK